MKLIELVKFVGGLVWRQVLQMILIIVTLALLLERNIFSITLTILVWSCLFKLFGEVHELSKPVFKEWFWMIVRTTLFTVLFILLFVWLGGYGLIGLVITLLVLAGYRIYSNWKLFDAVTTWGAERVKGDHKESFNIEKVMGEK